LVNSFFETFSKMSETPKKMMTWGVRFSLFVLLVGIFAYKYNQWFVGEYESSIISLKIVQAAFSLFVQFILGGIILDCVTGKK